MNLGESFCAIFDGFFVVHDKASLLKDDFDKDCMVVAMFDRVF